MRATLQEIALANKLDRLPVNLRRPICLRQIKSDRNRIVAWAVTRRGRHYFAHMDAQDDGSVLVSFSRSLGYRKASAIPKGRRVWQARLDERDSERE